jgi:hypothetical protein
MKSTFLAAGLALGILAFASPAAAEEKTEAEKEQEKWAEHMGNTPFVLGYEKGMKEAEFAGKPAMLVFVTETCGDSKALGQGAFKDAMAVKTLSVYVPVLVDVNAEKSVKAKYKVADTPTTIVVDVKGDAIGSPILGKQPMDQYVQRLMDLSVKIKPAKPSKDYVAVLAAKKKLDEALAKKQPGPALNAIADIERIKRPAVVYEAALAAKKQLLEEGEKRLAYAKEKADNKERTAALEEARALMSDYKGTEIGSAAAKLASALQAKSEE